MGDLTRMEVLAYSMGHFLNDVCASMWFSYFLVYYHLVLQFNNTLAGNLLLFGQIGDAIMTPFVGLESDRSIGWNRVIGKRKSWYLFGSVSVALSYVFVFHSCFYCAKSPQWSQMIYYTPIIVIFQMGWAATQVSHLALIPELTCCLNMRSTLATYRYCFTVTANIYVFILCYILLRTDGGSDDVGPWSADAFLKLALISVTTGIITTIIFFAVVKENPKCRVRQTRQTSVQGSVGYFQWQQWFCEPQYYMMGFLYMCTRLIFNFSQVYLPLYVTESLNLSKTAIAVMPLIAYVSGFLSSFIVRPLNRIIGRKATFSIGLVGVTAYCVMSFFSNVMIENEWMVYIYAILMGSSTSTLLLTVLTMTSDLIGKYTATSAFIYGTFSFLDKISNGIVINITQSMTPSIDLYTEKAAQFYADIITFVPLGVVVITICGLLCAIPQTIGDIRYSRRYATNNGFEQMNASTISLAENSSAYNIQDS